MQVTMVHEQQLMNMGQVQPGRCGPAGFHGGARPA